MQNWQAILLGIVQGLTEFLPVSSSGHLVLLEQLMTDIDAMQPLIFELTLHAGTLLAILLVYRYDILDIALFPFLHGWKTGPDAPSLWQKWRTTEAGWTILLTLTASLPTAVIGLLFEKKFEDLFYDPLATGTALLITGALLMASRLRPPAQNDRILDIPLWAAFLIGLIQGLAITPGISRSGSTIALALLLGVGRQSAGKLSFLICIPAIIGAVIFKLGGGFHFEPRDFIPLFLGFLFSFAIGYLALRALLTFIKQGRLHWWSWYCWAIGLTAIIWFGPLGH